MWRVRIYGIPTHRVLASSSSSTLVSLDDNGPNQGSPLRASGNTSRNSNVSFNPSPATRSFERLLNLALLKFIFFYRPHRYLSRLAIAAQVTDEK